MSLRHIDDQPWRCAECGKAVSHINPMLCKCTGGEKVKIDVSGSEAMDIISALKKASNQDEKDGYLYTARESLWTAKLFIAAISEKHRPTFERTLEVELEHIEKRINEG